MTDKTTLESLEKALERLEQIDGKYSWAHLLYEVREALAECKPAPDGRIPKTVFTLEDIGKAAEMGREAGRIDVLSEQALQKLSDFHQYMEATEPVKQEPVAWVNAERNTITWEKIYPNMEPLYAAPVSAPAQEPVAMRYGWDGFGYGYIDNGSGSDWQERHADGEPLYAAPVSAKRECVDLTCQEVTALIMEGAAGGGWQGFAERVLAAFKEKNK